MRGGCRVAIAVVAMGLVASIVLPIVLPVFQFPSPDGPYAIGTMTCQWTDTARPEVFSANSGANRELIVQIWYPAKADLPQPPPSSWATSLPRANYVQHGDALAKAISRLKNLPQFVVAPMTFSTTNAMPGAPVAHTRSNYPVLIFLEGALGYRQMNTFQVEHLVSHGYIVAAIDQPHTAAAVVFDDGREVGALPLAQMLPLIHQSHSPVDIAPTLNGRNFEKGIVPYLAQDVSFTIDQLALLNQADPNAVLTGRLNLQHIGTFGVSLGGIVGGAACQVDPRLQACLFMDAPMPVDVVKVGLLQPAMWITRDAETMRLERSRSGGWSEADIREHLSTMRMAFQNVTGAGYFVQIPGMFHVNLTDIPYLSPVLRWLGVTGPINAMRAHAIVNAYSLAFFNRHLLGHAEVLTEGPSSLYAEVIFEARQL